MELDNIKCTLCLSKCSPTVVTRSTKRRNTKNGIPRLQRNVDYRVDEDEPVKDQLQIIFLLRKILEIPQNQCCKFLQDYGDPCLWIDCCYPCSVLVEKAKSIFDEITKLQNNFTKVQNEIKTTIIQTLQFEDNVVGEEEWGAKGKIRSFIRHGAPVFENTVIPKDENIDDFPTSDLNATELNGLSAVNLNSSFVQSQRNEDDESLMYQQNKLTYDDDFNDESDGEQDPLRLDDASAVDDTDDNLDIKEEFNSYSEMNFNDECSNSYRTKATKKAVLKRNVKQLFRCDVCEKCFNRRHNLQRHERIHTGSKCCKFKCSFCGKGFPYPINVTRHERMHTGEKPYLCTVCGKGFSQSYNLQNHVRSHTGEKPYFCKVCGKGFSYLSNLKKHDRVHSGKKAI